MIDFDNKTYANILARQMKRVPDTLDKREGSLIQTALGPESWYLEGIYLDMERMQKNVYVETAGGESLDRIAASYGLERKPATHAVKTGNFDQEIPSGFRASALTGPIRLTYRVIEKIGVKEGQHSYAMQCETPGEIGNHYSGQVIPVDYVAGLTIAEITDIVSAGSDEEDDESLRKRIFSKIRKPSTSGNIYDYYNWTIECAGVGAAKIYPLALGPGTVKVVIADAERSAATPELIGQVKNHIEELRPIGADVSVVSAREKVIAVTARVKLQNGVNLGSVQEMFLRELTSFLQEGAFDVSYVSLAKVGNLLLNTAGVEDFTELRLNGQAANVSLADEEIAVAGAVTLEVIP